MRRNIYLDMKSPEDALKIFLNRLDRKNFPGSETVSVLDCLDRVTSEPVYASISSPYFHTAAMDGFAVIAESTFDASQDRPLTLKVGVDAWTVNTGRPLPANTNSVIMIENVNFTDDQSFEIDQAITPWKNVRRVGEDFVASEMIIPGKHLISAYELGALIAGGVTELRVTALPKVVLIPTGSELVPFDALKAGELKTGDTLEYNTVVLAGLVKKLGALPINHSIIPDNFETLKRVIKSSIESDAHMVVINAGSSAGSEDYTAAAIRELGEVLVHGIAMMPGKPTILGIIDGKPVIGNPGYPVSAILSFEVFGIPVLETMLGLPHRMRSTMSAVTARKIPSKLGTEEFFRVKLGKVGNKVIAAPLPRGAGSITTLTKADGILRIPARSEGIDHGSDVTIELLRPAFEIDRTLVAIGSHDLTIDILGDELRGDNIYLTSSHVGSLGGLLALKNHTAHFATSHLMDTETGIYNWSYITKYIPNVPVRMFNGVMREQGFMVVKNNPKGINSFSDLTRDDVKFINRQAGSGTRVLLDYYLDKEGINSDQIVGYDLEEYTHTSVAVAVLSGVADVGMGVLAAAQALGLDFIPIAVEEYDLVIPEEYMNDDKILRMLEVLGSSAFKTRVSALGGYGVQRSGEEIRP